MSVFRGGLHVRVLAIIAFTVGAVVIVPVTAEAQTPGCPPGSPGVGGESFVGGPGDDVIVGTPGDDYICAGAGDDVVDGGGGNDHIYGGPGKDELSGAGGADWIEGGAGDDSIDGGAGSDQIFADAGPAFENAPVSESEAGNDVVWGGSGADVIDGGPGNDIIRAGGDGEGNVVGDVVHGGLGDDVVVSDPSRPSASDSFFGDDGDDLLWPNPIRSGLLGNTVWGGAGNDVIVAVNGLSDGVELDEPDGIEVSVPGSGCGVTVPVLEDDPVGTPATVSCELPKVGPFDLSVTTGAESGVSLEGPLLGLMTKLTVTDLRNISSGGFSADICLCDPKVEGWAFADRVDQ